jgi:outer membrane protein OmpA-like peptidoglycan-associated protein
VDIIRDATGSVVVPFELARLRKGDIAVMYNVYFFKDAAVMRPESRYEVTSLLEMLNENPNYKIKIHGHTNGKAAGKIISLEKDTQNFFSLKDTKEGVGSAKKLSEERALIIKNYLESNGIDASRMEAKAWGGKRPIHDKMSPRAQENVRVEIEILED